ncbi:hypothetical protein A0H81_03811 [Grifola frondosa]|uniref:DUF1742-domain-containing protein n=1 Tax=Grifola frondosa TaxID=5627 RepID=A0A1C7MHN7_GRIFR|nr:hypothetical protein A0H81_03811 [Grifola frondosa]
MSFTNMYYKRAVGTARPCYICHKPTTTVLATINTVDFLYSCDSHLTDPGAEEIAKVKEEWEERQKKKQEKAKEKESTKDQKDEGKDKDQDNTDKNSEKGSKDTKKTPGSWSPPVSVSPPSTPSHQRRLHPDFLGHLGECCLPDLPLLEFSAQSSVFPRSWLLEKFIMARIAFILGSLYYEYPKIMWIRKNAGAVDGISSELRFRESA